MGVLCFSFLDAAEAKAWVDEYYKLFKDECRPIAHSVNPNFSLEEYKKDSKTKDRLLWGAFEGRRPLEADEE